MVRGPRHALSLVSHARQPRSAASCPTEKSHVHLHVHPLADQVGVKTGSPSSCLKSPSVSIIWHHKPSSLLPEYRSLPRILFSCSLVSDVLLHNFPIDPDVPYRAFSTLRVREVFRVCVAVPFELCQAGVFFCWGKKQPLLSLQEATFRRSPHLQHATWPFPLVQ